MRASVSTLLQKPLFLFGLDAMTIILASVFLFASAVSGGDLPTYFPDYYPESSLFGDCESGYMPWKHKCLSLNWHTNDDDYVGCMIMEGSYIDLIESDEERQFYFDELLGGEETIVFQWGIGNATFLFPFYGPGAPTDTTYLASKITDQNLDYADGLNCTVTQNDMACEPASLDNPMYAPCTYARPLYDEEPHPCHIHLKKKLRRDATRTITFPNDETDICYITVKSKDWKPSMVKVYGYSSMCPTGFLVTTNTDLKISAEKLPPMHCGDGAGNGRTMIKKRSGRGKEIRIYVVLNGDGMPMKIRAKGRAFL